MYKAIRMNTQLQGKPKGDKSVVNKDHLAWEAIGNKCTCLKSGWVATSKAGAMGLQTFGAHIIISYLPNARDGGTGFSACPVRFWSCFDHILFFL